MNDIPPTTNQILLESLEKWTEYRIAVVAHTEVGPGPESSPVIVRTDEDGKSTSFPLLFSPPPPRLFETPLQSKTVDSGPFGGGNE